MTPSKHIYYLIISITIIWIQIFSYAKGQNTLIEYNQETASKLADIPMNCLYKEYPNKLNQVLGGDDDLKNPQELHPAFYGCFDWHSSVHGHWMLIKLVKLYPDLPEKQDIFKIMNQNITKENIQLEINYFEGLHNKTFERTYGWAWLLKLAQELNDWDDPNGKIWLDNLNPIAELIAKKYIEFLPKLTYPIRTGEHPNTAFGLSLTYDYALSFNDTDLMDLIKERSLDYYLDDRSCPIDWEPNGFDFLSPCLEEANLMQKILTKKDFQIWVKEFIPSFNTLIPAVVSDRSDPKIVHLDGLNFSRTWCLLGISKSVDDPVKSELINLAVEHFQSSFPFLSSGNYEGEHWLTSFAILALTSQP